MRKSLSGNVPGKTASLMLVGVPIGDPGDLSQRAMEALRNADVIACEERREARRILARLDIQTDLIEINEHTEENAAQEVITEIISGKTCALISDCGMPVFADPGASLVSRAIDAGIDVRVVPGPTSLTTAMAVAGIPMKRFYFHGFLSAKKEERRAELRRLRIMDVPVVFLDAPYRLRQVLEDICSIMGRSRHLCVACDLTLQNEFVFRGTAEAAHAYFTAHAWKREYVIIMDAPAPGSKRPAVRKP